MTRGGYVIIDEPRRTGLERFVVDPMWPMFAAMFAGAWLGLAWFALNTAALGSPTRQREYGLVAVGVALPVLFMLLIGELPYLGREEIRYALLINRAVVLVLLYRLQVLQAPVFALWEHFGGVAIRGIYIVLAGFLLREPIYDRVVRQGAWWLVGLF